MAAPIALFGIYDDLGLLHPDILFHVGNAVWAKPGDAAGSQDLFERFRQTASALGGVPLYIAPGPKDIPDEETDVVYRKTISGGTPWKAFDYGNSHFVVLDSEVPDEAGRIAGKQLSWLQNDLDTHAGASHIFVFIHRSAFPVGDNAAADAGFSSTADRDTFTNLMTKDHVQTVFSGGQALYSSSVHDGVTYVNTGGGGSPSDVSPVDGGFLHYLLVAVNGNDAGDVVISPIQPGRLSVRATGPGAMSIYNSTSIPLILNRVAVLVPATWRGKHVGLLGAERLRVYKTTASVVGGTGTAEAAPVDLQEGQSISQFTSDVINPGAANAKDGARKGDSASPFDFLYIRVSVPARSAVTVNVEPTS